jgi:hypothetical protein
MGEIDRDLASALKLAKTKPMRFVLVIKSPGEGTLIVSKNAIKTNAIEEAKESLGGGQVFKGRCSGNEKGVLVFETAKDPPNGFVKTVRAVIKRDAGLLLDVDARRAADLSDEDEQDASKAAAKANVTRRLAALTDSKSNAVLTTGPDATLLQRQLETVKALIAKEDYTAAAQALDVLEQLFERAKSASDATAATKAKDLDDKAYAHGFEDGTSGIRAHMGAVVKLDPQQSKQLLASYERGFAEAQALMKQVYDYGVEDGSVNTPDAARLAPLKDKPAAKQLFDEYKRGFRQGEEVRKERAERARHRPTR